MPANRSANRPPKSARSNGAAGRPAKRMYPWALPIAVAAILNIPSLQLGYFWDDYFFLTTPDLRSHLLPDSGATFYRPIPLGLYFGALRVLDPAGGWLAHALNFVALLGVIGLLVKLVTRLCGERAGLFSGLVFAAYGQVPSLVAWVSASQDLFAILFVIAALYLRHTGRDLPAILCAAAALLCKETALAAIPVLALWDRLVGRPAKREKLLVAGYALIVILWAAVHPGIHRLISGSSSSIGYVGVRPPDQWLPSLARYLVTLLNLPPWGLTTAVRPDAALNGLLIGVMALLAFWRCDLLRPAPATECLPLPRFAWIGGLLAVSSLLMPAVLVRYAAPTLTCMASMGAAVFLGPFLAQRGRIVAGAAVFVFLMLGIVSRGTRPGGDWIVTESSMIEASKATRDVRANFQKVLPALPRGSQVTVSMGPIGRGVQMALLDGQALRLWYGDPTLRTVLIRERRAGDGPETLVRVTNDLDVLVIDPDRVTARSAFGREPDITEIDPPVGSYARTVAASGDTERAIRIMEGLNRIEAGDLIAYNRRIIASMLLAAGRRREADSIFATTADFPRDVALTLVANLQSDASPSERLDTAVFEAFGLSDRDPETIRWIMRRLGSTGPTPQQAWFAGKLQRLAPGDPEAAAVLANAARAGITPQRLPGRIGRLAL